MTVSKRMSAIGRLPTGAAQPLTPKAKVADEAAPSKQTIMIPRKVHRRLKEICLERNTSIQQILAAALDLWLIEAGEGSMKEIEES
jgi:hypothetical protein